MKTSDKMITVMREDALKPKFEHGRELMDVLLGHLDVKMTSWKAQAQKEESAATVLEEEFSKEHTDIKEIIAKLNTVEKEHANALREKTSGLEGPQNKIRVWLDDFSIKEEENTICKKYQKLMEEYRELMTEINILQKAYFKKCYMIEKVQKLLDNYPDGSREHTSIRDLQKKQARYRKEAASSRENYLAALTKEVEGRESFIKNLTDVKQKFINHEKHRMVTMVDAIGQYASRLDSQERSVLAACLNDLMEMTVIYDTYEELEDFCHTHSIDLVFPKFKEYISKYTSETGEEKAYTARPGSRIDTELITRGKEFQERANTPNKLKKAADTSGNATDKLQNKSDEKAGYFSSNLCYPEGQTPPCDYLGSYQTTPQSGFAKNIKHNYHTVEGAVARPNSPKEGGMLSESQSSKIGSRSSRISLPLLTEPFCESSSGRTPPSPRHKVETFPQIESTAEILTAKHMKSSRPNLTNMDLYQEASGHVPLRAKSKMERNILPHISQSVLDVTETVVLKAHKRSGDAPSKSSLRTRAKMDPNKLPKMTKDNSVVSSVKEKSHSERITIQNEQQNLIKSQGTPSLPQVAGPNVGVNDTSSLRPKSRNNGIPTLPLMPNSGTQSSSVAYSRQENRKILSHMPGNSKDGYAILPSKPKIKMDMNNTQPLSCKTTSENAAGHGIKSRHSLTIANSKGRLDSGIPAGYRSGSSTKGFTGKIAVPHEQRGMADGCSFDQRKTMPFRKTQDGWMEDRNATAPVKKSEGWLKDNLVQSNRFQSDALKDDSISSQKNRFSNADRLLNKYDIKNLDNGDSEEEGSLFGKADRLLAAHDIRNIFSPSEEDTSDSNM